MRNGKFHQVAKNLIAELKPLWKEVIKNTINDPEKQISKAEKERGQLSWVAKGTERRQS